MTWVEKFLHQQPLSEVLHYLRGMVPDPQFLCRPKGTLYLIISENSRRIEICKFAQCEQQREADPLPSKKVKAMRTSAC